MKKRYLVISHNYWPALGGAEKLLQSIAENLKEAGEDVEVLTSNAKNCNMYFSRKPEIVGKKEETINGVFVQREDIRNVSQKIGKFFWGLLGRGRKKPRNIGPLLLGPHFSKFVFKYIFSKKYTHIICGPFPTSVCFYGYLLKKIHPKTKLIFDPSLHVDDPMHTGRILRFLSRRADAFLVRTGEETRLLNSWGIDSRKIFEIGIGIDEELLKVGSDEKNAGSLPASGYILYMGQEVPHKNILVLLEAMRKVWKKGHQASVLIAGARTDYSEMIDKYMEDLDPEEQKLVFRVNDFDESLKKKLIDNCQFFAMPSSRESFGIVFMEAWARKKAVIGANVSGVKRLIDDGENGLLANEKDPDDLAQKILYLLENEDVAKKIGQKGYETVLEKYRWGKIVKRILSI